jgi:hypothetical protein
MKINELLKKPVHILLLVVIVFLALIRFKDLARLPSILNRDEAALAYNAYLLKETGRDEWGRPWPLALESFGDYKLSGYVIAVVAAFNVFGYSDWAVKLPSLLAGFFILYITYSFSKTYWKLDDTQTLFAPLLVVLTPVFFFYSRLGFEAHMALALLTGALTFWWQMSKNTTTTQRFKNITLGTLFYAISCITYNTPLLLLPTLALSTIWKIGLKEWKTWLPVVTAMSSVAVIVAFQLLPLTKQKSGITIFADPTVHDAWITSRETLPGWAKPVFGKKIVYLAQLVATNTLNSFSPKFLVLQGGAHPWHQVPDASHLSWALYILGFIGMFALLTSKTENKALFLLFLGALTPAIITTDAPHITRSLLFVWIWVLFAFRGFIFLSELAPKQKTVGKWIPIILVLITLAQFGWYLNHYWKVYPESSAKSLKAGIDTRIQHLEREGDIQVAVVDPEGYEYIRAAWYANMTPETFFATQVRQQANSIGFKYGERVGKYHFIASPEDRVASESALLQWKDAHWVLE